MTEKVPLISVVLPTYNRSLFLKESIETVLEQTVQDFELIVIDDGSTDNTRQVIKPYLDHPQVHYFYQENRGVSAARNNGLGHARGRFVALQDSDDLWMPDKLERQLPLFDVSPRIGLVHGKVSFFDSETGSVKGEKFEGETLTHFDILRHRLPATQTLIFRKEVLSGFEGFLEGLSVSEDYVFCAHISEKWGVHGTSEVVARVRQHAGQMSGPSRKLWRSHKAAIDYLWKHFGHSNEAIEAIREALDFYKWTHYCQLNDAARDHWRNGHLARSVFTRMQAVVCDFKRAVPRPLQNIIGIQPREYWGR